MNTETQPTQTEAAPSVPTPAVEAEQKPLTQADVDRIVADRLKRAEAKAEKDKLAAVEEALKRSKLEDSERLALEKKELEQKLSALETEAKNANLKLSLTGKVQDVNAALKLLESKHFDENGGVNVESFLADYAFMAPKQSTPTPTPTTGGNLGTGMSMPTDIHEIAKLPTAELRNKAFEELVKKR